MNKKKEFHKTAQHSLSDRVEGMRRALEIDESEKRDADEAALTPADVLAIRERKCLDIEFSAGGPADWVRVYLEDGVVSDVEYHYADWFEHEEVYLPVAE